MIGSHLVIRRLAPALTLLVTASSPCWGAVNFFTNRATWEAAIGSATFTEDFSSFAADAPFHTAPVALNGMTISREGPEAGLSNFIDVAPYTFSGGSGSTHAELFVNTLEGLNVGTNVRIAFDNAATAFGFNVWEAVGLEGARLSVLDGATELGSSVLPGGNGAFLGFIATGGDSATSVLFQGNTLIVGTSGEGFAMDDLAGVAVPELATGTSASLALVAGGLLRLRRRR